MSEGRPLAEQVECAHPDFEAQCIVTRLEDTGLFSMDVKVWCSACSLPFEFPESIPMGLDFHGVARNLSGQELRIAIRPATWPDDLADHPGAPALWRCDHYAHDTSHCTPTKHYPKAHEPCLNVQCTRCYPPGLSTDPNPGRDALKPPRPDRPGQP